MVPSFFLIFESLVLKIDICLQYFWDKNTKNGHSVAVATTD